MFLTLRELSSSSTTRVFVGGLFYTGDFQWMANVFTYSKIGFGRKAIVAKSFFQQEKKNGPILHYARSKDLI